MTTHSNSKSFNARYAQIHRPWISRRLMRGRSLTQWSKCDMPADDAGEEKSIAMKTRKHFVLALSFCVAAAAMTALTQRSIASGRDGSGSGARGGTDILHVSSRTGMTNEGVEPSASGRVILDRNKQGNSHQQRLDIRLLGLATNSTYFLYGALDDESELSLVGNVDTDGKGKAALHYRKNNHSSHLGRGQTPLPEELDPVSEIRELAIFNANTQAVLTADLAAPDKLQYLVKRDIGNTNVPATVRIKADRKHLLFRLSASGLNPTNDYFLVLNESIVQTNSTDASGNLKITSVPLLPSDVLGIRELAIWDSSSNVVVETELP